MPIQLRSSVRILLVALVCLTVCPSHLLFSESSGDTPCDFDFIGDTICEPAEVEFWLQCPPPGAELHVDDKKKARFVFSQDLILSDDYFQGSLSLINATFQRPVTVTASRFGGQSDFSRSEFKKPVVFLAGFDSSVSFVRSHFRASVSFGQTVARFLDVSAANPTEFRGSALFFWAHFHNLALFDGVSFTEVADFSHVSFNSHANFGQARFGSRLNLKRAGFHG